MPPAKRSEDQTASVLSPVQPSEETVARDAEEPEHVLARPVDPEGRPLPDAQLTPEQQRIRELEHQLAVRATQQFEQADEQLDETEGGSKTILIHILKDGFTALDRVWYRGQEIEFVISSKAYEDTKDRNGNSWVPFTAQEQMARWGDVHFAVGPWPGAGYEETVAEEAERKRNRRAPVIPTR